MGICHVVKNVLRKPVLIGPLESDIVGVRDMSEKATENKVYLALWFVPEGAQSAWTLQETHLNSTSYARDEARTSERLLDRQTP